jgi:hypothetical protein
MISLLVGGYGLAHCLVFAIRGEAKLQPESQDAAWVQAHWAGKILCEIAEVEALTNLPPSRFRGDLGAKFLEVSRQFSGDHKTLAPVEARFHESSQRSIVVQIVSKNP